MPLGVAVDGDIATLTIRNPAKKNALDPATLDALIEAVQVLPARGVRCAVLTSGGDIFSSGYDLAALKVDGGAALHRAVTAVRDGELPIVAALPGLAIGGGCELACACDLRVAHPGVALQMPPVRLGIVYPEEGLRRFVALIGASHTRELFLVGERVTAERALVWGLIDRLVDRDALLPTAYELARAISKGDPDTLRATRRLLA